MVREKATAAALRARDCTDGRALKCLHSPRNAPLHRPWLGPAGFGAGTARHFMNHRWAATTAPHLYFIARIHEGSGSSSLRRFSRKE